MTARRARRRVATVALLPTLPALLAAGPAQASHWPFFGGDNGRSGYQPIDEGTVPLAFLYAKNEPFIKSSIVTTTGSSATQRFGLRDPRRFRAASDPGRLTSRSRVGSA